jgi:UDP-N-acetylmuramoyl-tripeptide--D-alanyl-D-alanine ligase
MTLWTKEELFNALKSEIIEHNFHADFAIDEVVIDSRKTPASGLFIAIEGDNNDGHQFINQAAENGCKLAIISKKLDTNISTILVKNTFTALYKLAEFSRQRSQAKIIAITGSVGKTGTKEMLKKAFDTQGKTFATLGNLNNHFGVPLSLCNFARDCDFGIFEMGMNHANEIEPLSKLARPHMAIITNVGPVHIEFFNNEEEIALAKSEIFLGLEAGGFALINADNRHFDFLKNRLHALEISQAITFGQRNNATYQIIEESLINAAKSLVTVKLKNDKNISYEISSSNPSVIFNSIIVVAALDLFGCDLGSAIKIFSEIDSPAGRGKIDEINLDGKNIITIDDTYNASMPSMKSGISHAVNLKNILQKNRVIVALGDMLELGEKSDAIHQEVLQFALSKKVDLILVAGSAFGKAAPQILQNNFIAFENSLFCANEIKNILQDGDILYIKGSRGMKMENILKNLK